MVGERWVLRGCPGAAHRLKEGVVLVSMVHAFTTLSSAGEGSGARRCNSKYVNRGSVYCVFWKLGFWACMLSVTGQMDMRRVSTLGSQQQS